MGTCTIWICYSSHTNCVFHILQKVEANRKVSKEHISTLEHRQWAPLLDVPVKGHLMDPWGNAGQWRREVLGRRLNTAPAMYS